MSAQIAVVGSVAVDHVVRLAEPLAPGRHLAAEDSGRRLGGGAANVAVPLARAGHRVRLVSAVGQDAEGDWILAELSGLGLDAGAVRRVPGASTRSLVLLDPSGERTVVNLARCADTGLATRLRDVEADAVYVRTRETGLGDSLAALCGRCRVVAHVPPLGAGVRPAHVLVGSEPDLPADFLDDPWAAGRAVSGGVAEWTVVTRGPRGSDAFGAGGYLHAAGVPVEVVDTTGAGDAFAAGLVHALLDGMPMEASLRMANRWGAAAAAHAGSLLTSVPEPDSGPR